jgi:hypothetical protein
MLMTFVILSAFHTFVIYASELWSRKPAESRRQKTGNQAWPQKGTKKHFIPDLHNNSADARAGDGKPRHSSNRNQTETPSTQRAAEFFL